MAEIVFKSMLNHRIEIINGRFRSHITPSILNHPITFKFTALQLCLACDQFDLEMFVDVEYTRYMNVELKKY